MFMKISEENFKDNFLKWIEEKQLKNKKETITIQIENPVYHSSYNDDYRTESPDNNYKEIKIKETLEIDSLEEFMYRKFKEEMVNLEVEPKYLYEGCSSFFEEYYDEWHEGWKELVKQDYEESYER